MRTIETDVAVMGSGLAGLSAALTLAERGVRVALFEKRPFQGGALSNTPMITMAVKKDRKFQDRAFEVHCEFTNYNGNMGLARRWINESWRIPEFIKNLGLDFLGVVETEYEEIGTINAYTGGFPKGMNLGDYYLLKARGKGHGAALICLRAARKLESLGGEIHYNTGLKELLVDNGKCCGAIVREKSGEEIQVNAKAVIVATGGFSDNPVMIRENTPFTYTDKNCSGDGNVFFNHFLNGQMDGDGHKAVWAAGGAKAPAAMYGRHVPGPGIVGFVPWLPTDDNKLITVNEQPYLLVNAYGERFINEAHGQTSINVSAAMMNQPGKIAYLIFDDAAIDHLEQVGTDYAYMIFPAQKITGLREQIDRVIEKYGSKNLFKADNLEELAEKTGIEKEGLLRTVARYNSLCDQGYDEDFGKAPQYLYPVRTGKLYCIRVATCCYGTVGGIRVNKNCEVIREDLKPIKGLYSAGDCMAGELYGYPARTVCNLSTVCFTTGLICADEAEAYVKGEN